MPTDIPRPDRAGWRDRAVAGRRPESPRHRHGRRHILRSLKMTRWAPALADTKITAEDVRDFCPQAPARYHGAGGFAGVVRLTPPSPATRSVCRDPCQ